MSNVLMVAYYFPPLGGAGVQRTLKFVKHLPGFGWQPSLLTAQGRQKYVSDPTILADIPAGIVVHRTPALLLPGQLPYRLRRAITRWLLLVDEQIGWLPFAAPRAKQILRAGCFKVVYTTSVPYTDHLIGLQIKRATGLPWVADFRDPWIDNFASTFPTRFHKNLARRWEAAICHQADRVTVVSEPMRRALLERYEWLSPARVITLTNGYDRDDFTGITPAKRPPEQFTIVYTGTFYQHGRTPETFLRAARNAIDSGLIPRNHLVIEFVGNIGPGAHQLIETLDLGGVTHTTGYLPHRDSIAQLLSADVLLLVVGSGPGSEAVLTGKVFEYLAARKPILALAPPGAAADLMRQARAGVVVDPEDVAAISAQLVTLYHQWQSGSLSISPDEAVIASYDRRKLTERLATIFDEVSR